MAARDSLRSELARRWHMTKALPSDAVVSRFCCAMVVLVLGCARSTSDAALGSASDAGNGPEGASPVVAATCAYLARCHPEALKAFGGGDEVGCRTVSACGLVSSNSVLDLDACLDRLREDPCQLPLRAPFGHFSFSAGDGFACNVLLLPDGHACGVEHSVPGSPADTPGEGQACFPGEFACRGALRCSVELPLRQQGASFCGICRAGLAPGARCGFSDFCQGGRCVEGVCESSLADGEVCTEGPECRSGLCRESRCAARTYATRADGAALGEPCEDQDGSCAEDPSLACVGGACVQRPALGETCDGVGDCRVGHRCVEGTCRAGVCNPCSDGCGEDELCDAELGCIERAGEGRACASQLACKSDLYCDPRTLSCTLRLGDGAPCADDAWCRSATCDRDLTSYCEPASGGGVSCAIPTNVLPDGMCVPRTDPRACEQPSDPP